MKFLIRRYCCSFRHTLPLLLVLLFIILSREAIAQEPPPRPITVTWTNQNLSFGAFYQGAVGGTVIINSAGARSSTGDIVLLTLGIFSATVFEVRGNPGTVVSYLKPTSTLTDGSGHSLTLQISDTSPASPFVLTVNYPVPTQIHIGGILTIGNQGVNPPGNYSGTFDMTFVQE
jgi:hypothetical protein